MKDKNKTKEQLINKLKELEAKQKRTEESLRENEERYNTLLETIPHGIQEIDTSGVITFTNKACDEIFGYEKGESIGKSILDKLAHDYEQKKLVDYLKTLVEDQPPPTPHFEKNLTKEGEIIDVQVDWNYKRDKKGRVVGFVSVVTDITKRNMAEKQTREARDFLENIYKTSADGIMVTDQHGCITMVNEATAKMLGYSKDELIGKHTVELSPIGKNHEEQTKEFLSELFEKGIIAGFEHSWLKKDGSLIDFETSIALLKDEEGNVTGAVGGIRDVTERKRAEETLRKSEEKHQGLIEHANDAIVSINREGMIIGFNKKAVEMFGYSREEILGKPATSLAPPPQIEKQRKMLKKFKKGELLYIDKKIAEGKGLKKNGQVFS
ncbi:MAG: PAS domain S-box protein, partial [Deltaproteobacteria bacterium]|nr:PAS domain S-box protein [Deltaproteobacteria bacterium]